ncbi:MAG: hypothetical protein AAGD13_01290 [Pseudomonadota bacterium]
MQLGVICGMEAEARALGSLRGDPRVSVGISAARPDRATEMAEEMAGSGVAALVSWGIAGGLDPALPSGSLIVPDTVIDSDGAHLPLAGLRPLDRTRESAIAGSDRIVTTPEDKSVLHRATGAVAVDMESHRIARVAQAAGIPCLAIRAVSDTAARSLPPGTASALDARGRPRVFHVILGLARAPYRLGALLSAKRDLDTALATLSTLGVELLLEVVDALEATR